MKWMAVVAVGLWALPALAAETAPAANAPAKPAVATPAASTPAAATPAASAAAKPDPSPFATQQEKISYCLGVTMAKSLTERDIEVNVEALLKGAKDVFSQGKVLVTDEEVHSTLQAFQVEVSKKQREAAQKKAEENLKAGEAFLTENSKKEGVYTLPSGLQYKVLKAGTGPKPSFTDTVECQYRGTLIDGKEFDSSAKYGEKPVSFKVTQVIAGWTEALQLMPVGSKWQLFVPSKLAYADRGAGRDIGPNSTLIFEIELVGIKPPEAKPAETKPADAKPAATKPAETKPAAAK